MALKVKLSSSYTDYYDSWFDGDGYAWQRYPSSMGRPEMMKQLLDWGFRVPTYGIARSVIPKAIDTYKTDNLYFIVHTDVYDHSGEGKILVDAPTCLDKHRNEFVTLFLGNVAASRFYSYKFVKIGNRSFGLKTSGNYWKAEYSDDVVHRVCCEDMLRTYNDAVPHALYVIDYVHFNGKVHATSFNSAPILDAYGLQDRLPGKQCAELIKDAIEHFRAKSLNYCDSTLQASS